MRTFRHRRKLETRAVAVVDSGHGGGRFSALIGVGGRAAAIRVLVSHPATPLQAGLDAPARALAVVRAAVAPGSAARRSLLQRELAGLHYAVPRSGLFDDATAGR